MSVMATSRMLTRDDLDALPDDGLRHELIDGALVMTPAPGFAHQRFVGGLYRALHNVTQETDLMVLMAPFDVVLGPHVIEPDIIVAAQDAFHERELPTPPLLVVEVRSPTAAWIDEGRKLKLYEEAAVAHYWLADPTGPSITVLDLFDGRCVETAKAVGDVAVQLTNPLEMELIASHIIHG